MNRHTRRVAGTFALLAMTLFLVESVWASTCAPGMDMDGPATAAGDPAPASGDCVHGWAGHDAGEDDPDGERPCPFGPAAAAQACMGIASLPARAVVALAPSPGGAISVFIELTERDLLLEAALFHPPRA
jgi:hypothetical protein